MKNFLNRYTRGLKTAIPVCGLMLFSTTVSAQQNIDSLEFGIDNIAGFGQAAHKIPVTPAPVVTAFPFNVDISATSNGSHILYVRTHSITTTGPATGFWSETNYTYFYKQNNISATVSKVQKLEYFIDTDPGEGNAITISVTPATQVSGISFVPNIGSLANGFHVLFIRSLDQDGKWSITNYQYFYKQNNVPTVVSIVNKIEYFIDTDPGAGNGHPIVFTPATTVTSLSFNADVSSLPAGFHVLFIRSLDANGKWSITNYQYFYKGGPGAGAIPDIVKIEYSIDNDPGHYSAINIPVTASPDIANKGFSADITSLSPGLHFLIIRSLDSRNLWSINSIDTFRIAGSTLPLTLLNFSAAAAGNSVNVTWLTTFEQGLSKYEVEYSVDGTLFSRIGIVTPSNNPSGSSYLFRHLTPAPGKNFYRLKTTEADNSIHYSDTKLVVFNSDQPVLKIYPNPADKYFTLQTSLAGYTLQIISPEGKIVSISKPGTANPVVDVSNLPSGLYNIRVIAGNNTTNSFLIIKH